MDLPCLLSSTFCRTITCYDSSCKRISEIGWKTNKGRMEQGCSIFKLQNNPKFQRLFIFKKYNLVINAIKNQKSISDLTKIRIEVVRYNQLRLLCNRLYTNSIFMIVPLLHFSEKSFYSQIFFMIKV